MQSFSTVGQIAERYGIPQWKARITVEGLNPPVPRAGLYRLIPESRLWQVETELRRLLQNDPLQNHPWPDRLECCPTPSPPAR
jgi:hypothetical protein